MKFILFFPLIFLSACVTHQGESCLQIRAAFDIGSGSTRMQVAKVDICKKVVLSKLLEKRIKVQYRADLSKSKDGRFSKSILQAGKKALSELKELAMAHKPQSFKAVSTSSFRNSKNAGDFVKEIRDELGITIEIVSAEREGKLGLLGVLNNSSLEVSPESAIVWDIGGGSKELSRLTGDSYEIYSDEFASVFYKELLIRKLNKKSFITPNPIGRAHLSAAIALAKTQFEQVPSKWKRLLSDRSKKIIGIGGVHNYAVLGQIGSKKQSYNIKQLYQTILRRVHLTDEILNCEYASTEISNLIYVYSMMSLFGIDEVTVMKVNLTDGLLLD